MRHSQYNAVHSKLFAYVATNRPNRVRIETMLSLCVPRELTEIARSNLRSNLVRGVQHATRQRAKSHAVYVFVCVFVMYIGQKGRARDACEGTHDLLTLQARLVRVH